MGYYVMYKDTANYWRWRFIAANGKIIAVSSEAYVNNTDCLHSIGLMKNSNSAPVYEM